MATDWNSLAQLFYNGAYQTLPSLMDSATGCTLERGVTDELDLKPAVCTFRLNDPSDLYRPSNAASSLYGQTGPYMRGAFATGGSVRFTGETQKMTPGQTDDHQADTGNVTTQGNRWVDVRMSGPLGRVGQWRDPLASPMFTQISGAYSATLRGYWPMEDGRDSGQLANVVTRGRPGALWGGVTPAGGDGPAGSGQVVQLDATGNLQFNYLGMSTSAGYQIGFAMQTPAVDATTRQVWYWRTSSGYTYSWGATNASYSLNVYDRDGTNVSSNTVGSGTDAAAGAQWIYFRIKVHASGGTITVEPSWYAELAENFWGTTITFSGTMGAPTLGGVTGNAVTAGARYAHHFVVTGNGDNLESTDFTEAFAGYRRERSAERFARLCSSRSLPYAVRGTVADTVEMGVQPITTFQDQLKEIQRSERGLIFDRGDNIGVILATFGYLAEQAADPVLDLTWPDDIAPPLEETGDAGDTYNLVTVKNRNGSSATAELATGRLGTQDPPTGSGRIDKTVDVNLATDEELEDLSSWWLGYYTQGGTRFDTVMLDMDAHPELLTACNSAEPGMFMIIRDRTPDPILLMIISTSQKTNRKRNVFTFKVVPGDVFRLAVQDDPGSLQDVQSSQLEADYGTSDTWWGVLNQRPYDDWSTSGTLYDVTAGGERVTVAGASEPNSVALADGTFEDGYGYGWHVTGGTAVATTLRAHRGTTSVEMTTTGSPSQTIIRTDTGTVPVAAAPGQSFRVTMWVYRTTTGNVTCTLDWINSGGSWFAAASTTTSVPANTWTKLTCTGTAPANTAFIEYGPTLATPTTGQKLWVDDVDCQRTDVFTGRQLLLVRRAMNGVVKSQTEGTEVHIFEPAYVG